MRISSHEVDDTAPTAPRFALAGLVLVLGIAASVAVALWLHGQQAEERREAAQQQVERHAAELLHRLEVGSVLARAVQAWLTRVPQPSAEQFERFCAELGLQESFPAVSAVAYARQTPALAGNGEVAFVTELLAPIAGNERVRGLDVRSQPRNLQALMRSRDSGEAALSGGFALVQTAGQPAPVAGVVLRVPVYSAGQEPITLAQRRERFVGSLALSFRVDRLLRDVLAGEADAQLALRVSDISTQRGARNSAETLYAQPAGAWEAQGEDARVVSSTVEFGGRRWMIEIQPDPHTGWSQQWAPWATLVLGLLTTVLLTALLVVQLNARRRAEVLAASRLRQYRDSQVRFRELNELLPTAVLLARASDAAVVHANKVAREMFGIDPQHTGEVTLFRLFEDASVSRVLRAAVGGDLRLDESCTRMHGVDGAEFWASVASSTLEMGGERHWLTVVSDVSDARELTDRLGFLPGRPEGFR